MEIKISREQLDEIQKYSKIYNYILQSFTKTYFVVGEDKFTIFFYGQKGVLKSEFEIEAPEKKRYFQIEFSKWENALSKLAFADEITLRLTEKFLKLRVEELSDIINLGIIPQEPNDPEVDVIENYITKWKEENEDNLKEIKITKELVDAINITNAMFINAGRNNAIAMFNKNIMYSDRSLVIKALLEEELNIGEDQAILHKYTSALIPHLFERHSSVKFTEDYETLLWEDGNGTKIILTSEAYEINLPSEEELDSISPSGEDRGTLELDTSSLLNSLNFFNGFYEASIWKPLTFDIQANKESILYYRHPTTEITKDLNATGDVDGGFIIGSEMLQKLVNKAVDLKKEGVTTFYYDEESPGVKCNISGIYDVVFAKLTS